MQGVPRRMTDYQLRLRAHTGHDGSVGVATHLTLLAGQHLAALPIACAGVDLTTSDINLLRSCSLPCFRRLPLRPLALRDRLLLTAFLALIVVVEERARAADDLRAAV